MAETVNWRSPRLLGLLLALSVALNICAVGGFAYSRWMADRTAALPGHKLDVLAERLQLTAEQERHFEDFRHALRHEQIAFWQANRPLLEEAWTEIAKDTPDMAALQTLLGEMGLHRHAFQIDATASLIQFTSTLTPGQREKLGRIVLDWRDPAGRVLRNNVGN